MGTSKRKETNRGGKRMRRKQGQGGEEKGHKKKRTRGHTHTQNDK